MSSVTTITSDPAVAQYQLSLNKSLAKDADFNAVSERFSDAFHNPEVQDQIVKDIHELTNTIKDIKEAFRRIGESLVEFDNAVFLDVDGDHLQLGRPWRAYQTVRFVFFVPPSDDTDTLVFSASKRSWTGASTTRVLLLHFSTVSFE